MLGRQFLPNVGYIYSGLSTDTKPNKSSDPQTMKPRQGDAFLELDTRITYRYVIETDSWVIANAMVDLRSGVAGERHRGDPNLGYLDTGSLDTNPVLLHGTAQVSVIAGAVQANANTDGAAGDSRLCKVLILRGVTPNQLTIDGFAGEDGTARSVTLNGSTTGDTVYNFGAGLVNSGHPMRLKASAADVVLVSTRAA